MNLVDRASKAAIKALRRPAGVEIVYTRYVSSVTIRAVPRESEHTQEVGETIVTYKARGYMFPADELVLNGVQVTPERGDIITEGGESRTVLAQAGDAAWRYADSTKQVLVVYTKED